MLDGTFDVFRYTRLVPAVAARVPPFLLRIPHQMLDSANRDLHSVLGSSLRNGHRRHITAQATVRTSASTIQGSAAPQLRASFSSVARSSATSSGDAAQRELYESERR